jgi:hypothetical protein
MGPEMVKALADLLGKGGVYGFAAGIASVAMLMFPTLTTPAWRPFAWLGCFVGFALGLVSSIHHFIKRFESKRDKQEDEEGRKRVVAAEAKAATQQTHEALTRRHERLRKLTDQEKAILIPYVSQKTRSWDQVYIRRGAINELESIGVIRKIGLVDGASAARTAYTVVEYNIEDWAYDFLTENPSLVELKAPIERTKGNPE